MSEERLNEIKDSIDFQLRVCEINNYETDMIIEEKELYNEVLSNKILIQELRDTIDNQRETIDRLNNLNKQLVEECQRLDDEETRLNNIINELTDLILLKKARAENEKDYSKYYIEGFTNALKITHSTPDGIMLETVKSTTIAICKEFLDKLKALKENK